MKYKVTFISKNDKICERFLTAVSFSDVEETYLLYAKKILKIELCKEVDEWVTLK